MLLQYDLALVEVVVLTGQWAWWRRYKSPTKLQNTSTPRKSWSVGGSVSATCLEETEDSGASRSCHVDAKARRVHQGEDAYAPVEDRVGIG